MCDAVIIIKEQKKYAKYGIYKGIVGTVCENVHENDKNVIVNFERFGCMPEIYLYCGIPREDVRPIGVISRPIREGDRVRVNDEDERYVGNFENGEPRYEGKYTSQNIYDSMHGIVVSQKAEGGKRLVEFGRFGTMPEEYDKYKWGNLPGLTRVLIDEGDLRIIAPVDEDGNEIEGLNLYGPDEDEE